jgi:DNA-binding NarL/FixJ family response regulator
VPTSQSPGEHRLPSLTLLSDSTGRWTGLRDSLGTSARWVEGGDASGRDIVGVVTWRRATRGEIAELQALRKRHHGPILAVLSELPSTRGARAVAARVEGTVLYDDANTSLIPTLIAIGAGQCVVPRSIRQLVDRPPLSPRERQILAMVVLDFSNAEIARKLVVTESNVKNHLTSAFGKLGVTSRNAAAELILDAESGLGPGILRISPEEGEGLDRVDDL